jgi:hypothetical protein
MMIFKKGAVNENGIVVCGGFAKIELYNKHYHVVSHALIDIDDIETVRVRRWKLCDGYAVASRPITIGMHRLILKAPEDFEVDHINRDRLDNRKANLRLASRFQNARNLGIRKNNSTGVIGVYFDRRRSKWYSQIHLEGQTITLGYFVQKLDAINSRLAAEEKYFGDFAPQTTALQCPSVPSHGG